MDNSDELKDIPPMIPDRDDVDSHLSNRRPQKDEIVRPNYYAERVTVSTAGEGCAHDSLLGCWRRCLRSVLFL